MGCTYFVRSFDLVEMTEFTLLISDGSTAKVTHPIIISLLQDLKQLRMSYIEEEFLSKKIRLHELPQKQTEEFLKRDFRILTDVSKISKNNPLFNKVRIYTDHTQSAEAWLSYLRRDGILDASVVDSKSPFNLSAFNSKHCLFVTFQKNYEPDLISDIYGALGNDGTNGALTSYMHANQFWIDGLYIKDLGLPSHFSHIAKWRDLEKNASNNSGWLGLFDLFLAQGRAFNNPYRATDVELNLAAFHLLRKIIEFAGINEHPPHLNDMPRAKRVDLSTGSYSSEIVAAWQHEEPVFTQHTGDERENPSSAVFRG